MQYTRTHPEAQSAAPGLSRILADTRREVAAKKERRAELERAARQAARPPDWVGALGRSDVAVIAEIKRRSPSAGEIAPGLDPAGQARSYRSGGAAAISVLTDAIHFGGSMEDLAQASAAAGLPVLCKDFILDEIQLLEARARGASAVLLIVRALDQAILRELRSYARELGLSVLVEVHTLGELDRALAVEPESVGVNARDLETFEVNLFGIEPVLRAVPPGVIAVAESGISSRAEVELVARWGADAVLVGTALSGARDPAQSVRSLVGVPKRARGH
ncbi:MAG: indole-3-glycerol phosphate synthase [Gemmatimonadales bacterium]|nr:Indole-3-glycerol phosphate synthase [bacterium HR33]GIW50848.1 MAG: indole-3-glycerol phosphate synthase [Gemmatimonadales bacterium]